MFDMIVENLPSLFLQTSMSVGTGMVAAVKLAATRRVPMSASVQRATPCTPRMGPWATSFQALRRV